MKVAIDAMGGDYAPREIVRGAVQSAEEFPGDSFILVGDEKKIKKVLGKTRLKNIDVVHTDEYVRMEDNPTTALKSKKKASVVIAANMVKSKECDALISAGNTGALLQVGLLNIGRIKGIRRPALLTYLPTKRKNQNQCVLLDAGANADCRPEYLIQFARMGNIYMKLVKGIEKPRVGLMNIGEEVGKGNVFYRQIYEELKNDNLINFVGNVEPRALIMGHVDVAVADGFVGNLVLKSLEAAAEFMQGILREEIKKSIVAKVAALTMKPIFRNMKKRLDHSEYGGALLLGLDGIVVKSHG
ncbi:MAG: phosphate acyltransferase PlsX, partial [Vulcanimicrobiota bacterium]